MKFSSILFFVLLSLCSVTTAIATIRECASPASVESTCKSAAAAAAGKFTHEFCAAALSGDKSSETAGLSGLAAIAIKQALAHAISSESKFEDLRSIEDDVDIHSCFDRCFDAYAEAIDRLQDALDAINNGLHERAGKLLISATSASDVCQAAFEEVNVSTSPVSREDGHYGKLAEVAMAIMKNIE